VKSQKNKRQKKESKYEFDLKKKRKHKRASKFHTSLQICCCHKFKQTPLESKQSESFLLLHSESLGELHSLSLSLSLSSVSILLVTLVDSKDKESSRGLGKAPPLQQHSTAAFFQIEVPGCPFFGC